MKKILYLIFILAMMMEVSGTIEAGDGWQGAQNQAVNLNQAGGTALTTGAGASTSGTPRVILASDSPGGAVTVTNGANTVLVVISTAVAGPIVSTQAVTTTANPIVNQNLTRKGVEIEADCANTDFIYINFGKAATTTTGWPVSPCGSWQPPPGVTVGAFISQIAASGTQASRAIEYP